MLTKID